MGVYPRVCGGTADFCRYSRLEYGLSPRVRGNPEHVELVCELLRSIPACAGEPSTDRSHEEECRVYPRVCGGTQWTTQSQVATKGLSPRVRGNRVVNMHHVGGTRSIPACAGEPAKRCPQFSVRRVYPRVCGGTQATGAIARADWGLSPRVRGNRTLLCRQHLPARSIPACAGEPRIPMFRNIMHRVYPRVCGGTAPGPQPVDDKEGLSPRVRGNRDHDSHGHRPMRSIPACAGEP